MKMGNVEQYNCRLEDKSTL
uniref:Uncharacterized protein n=1 Tax=Rhizophora mucronata TaxID=61149 RepID=A0A2P2NJM8_RHIMU